MKQVLYAAMALAVLLAAGMGVAGKSLAAEERTVIKLPPTERAHFRKGMRVYLESIEGIIEGMSKHKMGHVAKAAKKSGVGMVKDVSLDTALAVPPEFSLMSMDTHEKFDDLAKTAHDNGTKLEVMTKLSTILGACTSCHAAYKLSPQ